MTELEKIEYAKSFIDKLANGINPLDDTPVPDGDISNNVRLSRCFFFVSEILRQVIENGGTSVARPSKQRKKEFSLTEEERAKIQISDRPLYVSEIAARLNEAVDSETTKKISASTINSWLQGQGFLELLVSGDGKKKKVPTGHGKDIGIFSEERTGQYGTYIAVLFSGQAQEFIYDNIEAIIGAKNEKNDPLSEFHARPWTEAHDSTLIEMFRQNISISEISKALRRTESGVQARLKELEKERRV